MMFDLGFTMEELMFPENYQTNFLSNCLINKFDDIIPIDDYHEQIILDEDDDWFTIKQLHSDISSNDNNINDQILPSDNLDLNQIFDNNFILPNLSIKIIRDKNNTLSSSSDIISMNSSSSSSSSSSSDQHLLKSTIQQQSSNKYLMSKSISSLSFCTQSSTSITNSSTDDISLHSNDLNEISIIQHSTDSVQNLFHHKRSSNTNDKFLNVNNRRRRRKRTIFTATDIEHLKEAFIQNPKPNQQDIAILSEQLGHDSYVIRVWFYNKRQATKKMN